MRGELDFDPGSGVETVEGLPGTLVDLTPMRRTVAALQRSEELHRAVVGALDEGVVVLSQDMRVVSANASALAILELDEREILGSRPPFDTVNVDGSPLTEDSLHAAEVLREGRPRHGIVLRRKHSDGSDRWLTLNLQPLMAGTRAHGVVCSIGDITQRREADRRLREERDRAHHLAYHDRLTGLPNRMLLEEHLRSALARSRRHGTAVALLLVDLDDFRFVNDSFGHVTGDAVLNEAASRLTQVTRSADLLARPGGDELLLLLADLDEDAAQHASAAAMRVLDALGRPFRVAGADFALGASIGIALAPRDASDADGLLKAADAAMVSAKRDHRNGFSFFEPSTHDPRERLSLTGRLRRAIARDELEVHFQPIVRLADGGLHGAEALVRWRDPERGLVPPGAFIPVAEETGLINQVGEAVLDQVCAQILRWRAEGLEVPLITVNLSPRQLRTDDSARQIIDRVRATGIDPEDLCLEITESTAMEEAARSGPQLTALSEAGFQLAIDDFGAGHSSLARLRDLPVGTLKIDRSFLVGVPGDVEGASIVAAVVALARGLGMTTVAEGVELAEQQAFLAGLGCELVQGYHLGRPGPPEQLARRLKQAAAEAAPPAPGFATVHRLAS